MISLLASLLLAIPASAGADCNDNGIPDDEDIAGIDPVGYWRFEEQDGPVFDSGPNGLDGTATGTVAITEVPVDPVTQTNEPNDLARQVGIGASVEIADPGGLLTVNGGSFTLEAWVRLDTLSDTSGSNQRQTLVQKKPLAAGGADADYFLLVQGGNIQSSVGTSFGKTSGFTGRELVVLFGSGGGQWIVTSNLEIGDNQWHHVSFAHDGGTGDVRFGIDGSFETVATSGPGYTAASGPLLIGAHTNASGVFNHFVRGAVDEVRFAGEVVPTELLLRSAETADCNGNGVLDGCDIDDGTSLDCDGNGRPDECELDGNDCDGNGIPDACDPDCNGNGIPDACDIAAGDSADCQPDGIPDECQLDEAVQLVYDNGDALIAVRSDEPYMAWLNRFNVAEGAGVVDAVEVMYTGIPLGTPVEVHVWTDPDGDGDPTDAQLLWSGATNISATGVFLEIDVPDVEVGATGASFFVGCTLPMPVTEDDFPALLDVFGSPAPHRSWLVGANTPIDPNDIAAGAVEFRTIDDIYFGGNWLIRSHMRGPGTDCNGNGEPDDCDIADETSLDTDGNGVPDECEDCNGNGVVDGFDIADGTSDDCQGDGVPDECQVAANDCDGDGVPDDCQLDGRDCNGNGVLDSCDIQSGFSEDTDGSGAPDECEDCNSNGVLDAEDIFFKASFDCNGDGVPDECQFGPPVEPVGYALDDGIRDSNLNVIGISDQAWMNHFVVRPGAEWITAVEVIWGNTYPGLPGEVVIWSDPDGDGDPADAQVLVTGDALTQNVLSSTYNTVPVTPTWVGPAGTSFFVGAHLADIYSPAPAAIDNSDPDGQSWLAYGNPAGPPLDLNDLSAYGYFQWHTSDFMVRAVGSDGTLAADCNTNQLLDPCDIDSGGSDDLDGNGVPDECDCPGDTDGDGDVDVDDLNNVILDWGSDGSANGGDVTGAIPGSAPDGIVNVNDLVAVIGAWGDCP